MESRANVLRRSSRGLWVVQTLLAILFVFAGGSKLIMPAEALTAHLPVTADFLRFIGVVETLGALGLVLPGLFRIHTGLTPLAAAGLVIVMNGATGFTLAAGGGAQAAVPFALGVVLALVAYSRSRLVPHRASSPDRALGSEPAFV